MQISQVGSLVKQSADNQPLFPSSKLLLNAPDRMCRLAIFAVCLLPVLSLIVETAMYSICYYQTNCYQVALRQTFQQEKKKIVKDLGEKCDEV